MLVNYWIIRKQDRLAKEEREVKLNKIIANLRRHNGSNKR